MPEESLSYRMIWTVFVTIAIGLFVYQAGSRTHTFYKYNTNVDSAVIYTNEMAFPTVTLCNQNAYRWVLSKAFNVFVKVCFYLSLDLDADDNLRMV